MTSVLRHTSLRAGPGDPDPDPATPARWLTREACEALAAQVFERAQGGGETAVRIDSHWTGSFRWARNRPTTAGETTDHTISIGRSIRGARSEAIVTNQFDEASLTRALRSAERLVLDQREDPEAWPLPGLQHYVQPTVWSAATIGLEGAARSDVTHTMAGKVLQAQLQSAGYLQVQVTTKALYNTNGMAAYGAKTSAEYSVTVRTPSGTNSGTGSGWAGMTQWDWAALDPAALTARAIDKCVASANPVRIEPGRYTTVLEPQAVHGLMTQAVNALDRVTSEQAPMTVYTVHRGLSKIGRPVFDKRITLNTDPLDPVAGYIPFDDDGYPYRAVEWVKDGVLRELGYGRLYALTALGHGIPQQNPFAYRMSGGPTSIAEMVASTERGLLVTRFSGVELLDPPTLLMTGTTRDGVWLIEHGRITKAVANMRFVESPMFVFNKVQQLGPPVRVYSELPVIVPPVKVDDFHFTTLSDSV